MTLEEFGRLCTWEVDHRRNPDLRRGQALFNITHQWFPEIANKYRATTCDPFYDDRLIKVFLLAILKNDVTF